MNHAPFLPGGTSANPTNDLFELPENQVDQVGMPPVESLCMNCHENGNTRMLLSTIPYFREVILMSFSCDHCGFSNSEVQFGGTTQERGIKITVDVQNEQVSLL